MRCGSPVRYSGAAHTINHTRGIVILEKGNVVCGFFLLWCVVFSCCGVREAVLVTFESDLRTSLESDAPADTGSLPPEGLSGAVEG